MVCEMKGLELVPLLEELTEAARLISIPSALPYHTWKVDFLTDYIINIHHHYLRQALPSIHTQLQHFVNEHKKKYPFLFELLESFNMLKKTMLPHLDQEEEIIFPYILQIAHAYESRESYASLLVRTLRKPVEALMEHEHEFTGKILNRFRSLTDQYTPPENACTSHKLSYLLLKELDADLVQHMYLENEVLFPRAIAMEKELLER